MPATRFSFVRKFVTVAPLSGAPLNVTVPEMLSYEGCDGGFGGLPPLPFPPLTPVQPLRMQREIKPSSKRKRDMDLPFWLGKADRSRGLERCYECAGSN